MILDSYGAADVVVPEVHLKRLYPGGPAIGTFTARFGPDNAVLDRFTLRVENSGAIPRLLDEGVRRPDQGYTRAHPDRKTVGEGKRVSVRVDRGGGRNIQKKKKQEQK